MRSQIIRNRQQQDKPEGIDGSSEKRNSNKQSWSVLLKITFNIDTGICLNCKRNGTMVCLGVVECKSSIKKILKAAGLNPHPPPIHRARFSAVQ
ncbi:MAG: hypothetical protein AB8C84_10925 [Oligoflexales bacterium]